MEEYETMPMIQLASIIINEKKTNKQIENIYQIRRERISRLARGIAYLAQDNPFVITFPRHPEFNIVITTSEYNKKYELEAFFNPENRYDCFSSICYIQTAMEIYDEEDAKALLRSHFNELQVEPCLNIDKNGIQIADWAFPSELLGDFIEGCESLLRDDYFIILKGDAENLMKFI